MKYKWAALHDHDFQDSGFRDVIEGEIEAQSEEEAIDLVRQQEGFGDLWDIWIKEGA